MTRKEADHALRWFEWRALEATMPGARRMYQLAVEAIREYVEREKAEPLTLDELRRMVGEPVWAVRTDGGDMLREKKAAPCVLDYTVGFGAMRSTVIAIYGRNLSLGESDYGKTWLAYRCKPAESAKDANVLTNADRIRAMTDEELAELFCRADFCEVCDQLRPTGTCMAMETETEGPLGKHCVAAALRWLQQPAEGGGE